MKIIVLGDTHGRNDWKTIIDNGKFDKIIFLGDYFDTKEGIDSVDQIKNFNEIIEYKKANEDKVVLLFGNHDFHYLPGIEENYGGYQQFAAHEIGLLLSQCISERYLKMIHCEDNFLFSHAGVTKTWCENNIWINQNMYSEDMCNAINDLFYYKPKHFKFTVGKNYDQYGDDICQTPIWVRPQSLLIDMLDGYIHVVGHTMQDNIKIIKRNDKSGIILIDTLGTSQEYLVIQDGVPEVRTIKK